MKKETKAEIITEILKLNNNYSLSYLFCKKLDELINLYNELKGAKHGNNKR